MNDEPKDSDKPEESSEDKNADLTREIQGLQRDTLQLQANALRRWWGQPTFLTSIAAAAVALAVAVYQFKNSGLSEREQLVALREALLEKKEKVNALQEQLASASKGLTTSEETAKIAQSKLKGLNDQINRDEQRIIKLTKSLKSPVVRKTLFPMPATIHAAKDLFGPKTTSSDVVITVQADGAMKVVLTVVGNGANQAKKTLPVDLVLNDLDDKPVKRIRIDPIATLDVMGIWTTTAPANSKEFGPDPQIAENLLFPSQWHVEKAD